jgi:hypothetical protein
MENAFKVTQNGQTYDYRIPSPLNLTDATNYFSVNYKIVSPLTQSGRHVIGILSDGSHEMFLKLATTPGISILTKNEYAWNEAFNRSSNPKFQVPKNITSGEYNGLFYSLTEKLSSQPLAVDFKVDPSFQSLIPEIIDLSEYIMSLKITGIAKPDVVTGATPQAWFVNKTKAWLDAIPIPMQSQYSLLSLLGIVETGASALATKPRHGDFTPWHIGKTMSGLSLYDGEHAMSDGVELYDIGYLIQRVHTISQSPDLALKIFLEAEKRGHQAIKLKTILAARAIGGFLDAHLANKTDLTRETQFKDWAKSL